jgi:hypothetical protein
MVIGLLVLGTATLVSCASSPKETAQIVNDPDAHADSQIPWDRQEKWEVGGPLSNVTDRAH